MKIHQEIITVTKNINQHFRFLSTFEMDDEGAIKAVVEVYVEDKKLLLGSTDPMDTYEKALQRASQILIALNDPQAWKYLDTDEEND